MTTHEKARMIEYINYCAAIGDSNRRASRKWDVQYIAGWLAGSAHTRHAVAKELAQYIEVCELLEDDAWLKETEHVPVLSTTKHGTSARKGARTARRFGIARHTSRGRGRRHYAPTQTIVQPTKGGD